MYLFLQNAFVISVFSVGSITGSSVQLSYIAVSLALEIMFESTVVYVTDSLVWCLACHSEW